MLPTWKPKKNSHRQERPARTVASSGNWKQQKAEMLLCSQAPSQSLPYATAHREGPEALLLCTEQARRARGVLLHTVGWGSCAHCS